MTTNKKKVRLGRFFPLSPLPFHSVYDYRTTQGIMIYISYNFDKWSSLYRVISVSSIWFFFSAFSISFSSRCYWNAQRRFKEIETRKKTAFELCVFVRVTKASVKRRQPHWNGVKPLTPKMKWKYMDRPNVVPEETNVHINIFMTCYRLSLRQSHHSDRHFVCCAFLRRYWNA